jgi:hypothetical protein
VLLLINSDLDILLLGVTVDLFVPKIQRKTHISPQTKEPGIGEYVY